MLAFHKPLEREFARHGTELERRGVAIGGAYKTALLEAELGDLGGAAVAEACMTIETAAHAAGAYYVMEGSTLGGTLIAQSAQKHLGYTSRYYGCYGAKTAERWRHTRMALDAFPRCEDDLDAMICGARNTFEALHAHLQKSV